MEEPPDRSTSRIADYVLLMGISKGIPAPSSGPTATSSKNYLPELLVRFIESEGVICWDWNLVKTVPIVPAFTGILIYIYIFAYFRILPESPCNFENENPETLRVENKECSAELRSGPLPEARSAPLASASGVHYCVDGVPHGRIYCRSAQGDLGTRSRRVCVCVYGAGEA